jgi:hypothetical protein
VLELHDPIRISVYPQTDNPRTPSRIRIASVRNPDKSAWINLDIKHNKVDSIKKYNQIFKVIKNYYRYSID